MVAGWLAGWAGWLGLQLSEMPGWGGRPDWLAGGGPRGPESEFDRAGCSGLAGFYRRAAADWHFRGPQNGLAGLGWAGLAGWLAGLQAVSNSVPESSVPKGPAARRLWAAANDHCSPASNAPDLFRTPKLTAAGPGQY